MPPPLSSSLLASHTLSHRLPSLGIHLEEVGEFEQRLSESGDSLDDIVRCSQLGRQLLEKVLMKSGDGVQIREDGMQLNWLQAQIALQRGSVQRLGILVLQMRHSRSSLLSEVTRKQHQEKLRIRASRVRQAAQARQAAAAEEATVRHGWATQRACRAGRLWVFFDWL